MKAKVQSFAFGKNISGWLLAAVFFAGLYFASLANYLLFHTLAELFSILIAWSVFVLAWNARPYLKSGYLLFLGIALLFVGIIDLFHTLAYSGMNIFPGYDANLPTQLWLAARYMQSAALVLALLWVKRPLHVGYTLAAFSLITTFLIGAIFGGFFPVSYVTGTGLTPFKIVSEYLIITLLALAAGLLWRSRQAFNRQVWVYLVAAIGVSILAELAFTLYVDVYGFTNLIGHGLKILAFFWIYKAIIETGFKQPFNLLLRDLSQREADLHLSNARLEQANAQLQAAVQQSAQHAQNLEQVLDQLHSAQSQLEAYTQKLEDSNRDLEQFAYVASHDLKEPLRKITSFGGRLQAHLAGKLDANDALFLDRMVSAAQRMQTMIDALLTFARVTTTAHPHAQVDLAVLVQEVTADLETRLEQTAGRIEAGELPTIEADELQMRQLLLNLLGNALKFHRPAEPPLVRVTAEITPQAGAPGCSQVTLHIQDNGVGFDPEHHDRIFKPFERLHGRSEFEGSGMGLAICHKIVERHHGTIRAASAPGAGSVFSVTLPCRQPGE